MGFLLDGDVQPAEVRHQRTGWSGSVDADWPLMTRIRDSVESAPFIMRKLRQDPPKCLTRHILVCRIDHVSDYRR